MYYLLVRNLDVERCIHSSEKDLYKDGMSFSCTPDLEFPGGDFVREVTIRCSETPDPPMKAGVYKGLITAGLILLLVVSGCTSVKRFKSASFKGENHALADISLFGTDLSQVEDRSEIRNLWDLSASAQTQMIQILDRRYPDNTGFAGALNRDYLQPGFGPLADYTTRNLRMVFSISRGSDYASLGSGPGIFSPADRIESLRFSLELPLGSGLHFTGWNRYTTEYGEIEIADVSFNQGLDLEISSESEFAEGGVKRTSGRNEQQEVKVRYLKLNGSISDSKIRVEEMGNREIDLAGNVVADVSLRFDSFPEIITVPIFEEAKAGSKPLVSSFRLENVMVPRMEEAPEMILARLTMEYVYRHVESGWKTYQEWDDRVAYYKGSVTKEVPLLTKEQYLPDLYCIGTDREEKELVKIRSHDGREISLKFRRFMEAERVLEWLSGSRDTTVRGYELIYEGQNVTGSVTHGELKVMPYY